MRIFKNKWFVRFSAAAGIEDADLLKAIEDAQKGLIDADLGGGVIKQRIARDGQGASGGFRTIVIYQHGRRAFFVFGFAKSRKANIKDEELKQFKKIAKMMFALSDKEIDAMVTAKSLTEI